MGRRLGARRLYSLEKTGRSVTSSLGNAVSASVGHRTTSRDGSFITTEIYVDLAASGGGLTSTTKAGEIIAHTASNDAVTDGKAHLIQVTDKECGIVNLVEVACVETPAGGVADIDLAYHSTQLQISGTSGTNIIAATGSLHIGQFNAALYDHNVLKDQYIYLRTGAATSGGSPTGNAYTAGKLVIRLYGVAVPDDV